MAFNATFWSYASLGPYLAAIPYTNNSVLTGPYLWSNQGQNNSLNIPNGAPGCRVGAAVGQFLMLGDLYQGALQQLFTGNGSQTTFSGSVPAPLLATGAISDQQNLLTGAFANGIVTGTGYLSSGTINYTTGALALTFGTAPPSNDNVYCAYTQVAPYRVQWSAIGDPTNWPVPLTQAALAVQSGYQDLQADLGQVMFIAGYPLYALIFQRFGITLATYVGGSVVFSFAPYEFTRGVIAHGAAVQVGPIVFFLADDGFYATDGANVIPIGTSQDNSSGIDNWFWNNVNQNALEAIRAGYDATKRCIFFAIPTGTNTLPDTLLSYNPAAKKWTRSNVACETIWTFDNGQDAFPPTRQTLGLIDQTHTPNTLTGSPMTGYLEHCDLYFVDAQRRLTTGVRPIANQSAALLTEVSGIIDTESGSPLGTDPPSVMVGVRDSVDDIVNYGGNYQPDSFSRIAPALSSGIYTRMRVTSSSATALKGGTLYIETEGMI
jgi:hypothetical protein